MPESNTPDESKSSSENVTDEFTTFVFGDFELYLAEQKLAYKNAICEVEPNIIQLLSLLIQFRPNILSKEYLASKIWPDLNTSDLTLARLISDARKILNDDGNSNLFIKTTLGEGYSFIADVEEKSQQGNFGKTGKSSDANKPNGTYTKNNSSIFGLLVKPSTVFHNLLIFFSAIILILTLMFSITSTDIFSDNQAQQVDPLDHTQNAHILAVMLRIKENLALTKNTYLQQRKKRKQLKNFLLNRTPNITNMTEKKKFEMYYSSFTDKEKSVFNEIRMMTEDSLYKGNTAILAALNEHPELFKEVDDFHALKNHLALWEKKYQNVFLNKKDVSVVYVGEEDGVPFPSKIDSLVDRWIQAHSDKSSSQ